MKIKLFNNYSSQTIKPCKKENDKEFSSKNSQILSINNVPTNCIKANYLPNFGKYKKVADITLIDKDTERPVRASLRKERTGDFISFEITTGRKDQAGFLHMDLEPEDIYQIPQNKNGETIPEVTHLCSIKGDKYKGIGTTLIRAAINESLKENKNGALFLHAETGYGKGYTNHRKDESPIPFYYKMGFKAFYEMIDSLIQDCLNKADYENLPPSALLILSEDTVKAKNIQFSKNYKFD